MHRETLVNTSFTKGTEMEKVMIRLGQVAGGLVLAAMGLTATPGQAATIALSSAIQAGDYVVSANTGSGSNIFYQVRPTNPSGSQIVYNSAAMASGETGGVVFGQTGDLYYWSGVDNTSGSDRSGFLLQKIQAGQTTSTTVIADMSVTAGTSSKLDRTVVAMDIAGDGAIYTLQGNGKIYRFSPDGLGGYNTPTFIKQVAYNYAVNGTTFRLVTSGSNQHLLLTGQGHSPGMIQSVKVTDGTVSTYVGKAVDTDGVLNRPDSFDIDYAHPFNDGKLPVYITSINALTSAENTGNSTSSLALQNKRRITILAFDPTTGQFSNPYAGSGNVPGDVNAMSIGYTDWGTQMDIRFDNQGNLVVMDNYQNQYAYLLTAAQVASQNAALKVFSDGTTAWYKSGTTSLNSVYSFDIAPIVPEPASAAGLAAGCVLTFYRRRGAND